MSGAHKSLQATRDGALSSAIAEDVISPACLSWSLGGSTRMEWIQIFIWSVLGCYPFYIIGVLVCWLAWYFSKRWYAVPQVVIRSLFLSLLLSPGSCSAAIILKPAGEWASGDSSIAAEFCRHLLRLLRE
jgi:hypothetical protein